MFLQLVVGKVADAEGLQRQWARWSTDVAPGANGWVRSSGGITSAGRALVVTMSRSGEAAALDASRPEHEAWWSATRACLAEPVVVRETDDVGALEVADPGDGGFLQVMCATSRHRARFEQLETELGPAFVEFRPDFLAGYRAWFPDGTLAAVDHFRSEAEARSGESAAMPPALQAGFAEWLSLVGDTEWHDVPRPWHASPA